QLFHVFAVIGTYFQMTAIELDLLYLSEVKGAVMDELGALNARLGEAQRRAEAQAMTDPLTGLANRRGFEQALARMRAEAHRGGSFALLHIDLDHFKAVNDTFGHAAGDEILSGVAGCIRAELRAQDVTARIGGDEFVALVSGVKEAQTVQKLADRIIARIEGFAATPGERARVSASIGAVLSRRDPVPDADALLAEADTALYAAKRAGRGRCVVA
ncbi:MAG: GGDEF domain-containing protein, partial [Albidovulum sp.]